VISSLNAQALITSVAPAPINKFINNQAKWFHVEHGQAIEMV
jgi:recombinational DNA repair ATPase RecF